jgi:Outer membrane protein beta-barrel domain
MLENEFEKRVREKMDQLGFDPSDTVWTAVDKEINKEKKRRTPIFWLFFFSGLLLAGGVYYFIENKNNLNTIARTQQQGEINKERVRQSVIKVPEPGKVSKKEGEDTRNSTNQNSQTNKTELNRKPLNQRKVLEPGKEKIYAGGTNDFDKKGIKKPVQNAISKKTDDIVIDNYSNKNIKTESENAAKNGIDSPSGKTVTGIVENKTPNQDSVSDTKLAKNKNQKTKSSTWQIGFTGGAGISNINQGLFNSDKSLSINNPASAAYNPVIINNPVYSSSEITPGFSFTAGAFVQRNLSKRISLSAGLNYHYYSAKIKTGSKVNAVFYTTNSTTPLYAGNNYYQNGDIQTFTEQYHLIEMPVSVNFQLNKSNWFPFIWEIGLSPGYIIGSNALYYDPNTNIYIVNYQQPNKIQLNGSTAVLFGFRLNKNELQIGPQLQYGLTGLLKINDGNTGHLFYGGLKISFIPSKK